MCVLKSETFALKRFRFPCANAFYSFIEKSDQILLKRWLLKYINKLDFKKFATIAKQALMFKTITHIKTLENICFLL